MLEVAGTESEGYEAKLDRFFDRIDGAAGHLHGIESPSAFVARIENACETYPPLADAQLSFQSRTGSPMLERNHNDAG
jgi:hypothetical protein